MKKNIIFSLLLLSLIMLSITTLPTSATDYTKVGVKVGDTADYSYSTPTEAGRLRIHIQKIAGTTVTVGFSTLNPDGSEKPLGNVTGDLSGTFNPLFGSLIASDLSQNDSIFPGSIYTIDKTTTMIVTGVNRTVNHVSYSQTSGPSGNHQYLDAYWDKATGLSVKLNSTITGEFANASLISNLTSTTAFGNNIDPTTLLVIAGGVTAILAATAIAVLALEKKKKSMSK